MPPKKRRWARWLVVAPVALVSAVLLLELLLQLGALAVSVTGRERSSGWSTEGLRILAMGDSNTYGLWLEREQAYPAVLEREWNRLYSSPQIEVINLGYPGTNSSRILKDLPAAIEKYSPDLVTMMVGVNDFWIPPSEGVGPRTSGVERWLRAHSRVYKLWYMLVRDVGPGAHREIGRRERRSRPERMLQGNLLEIAGLLRQRGIPLILITYPHGEVQTAANGVLHRVAVDAGVPLVDTAAIFETYDPATLRAELLFDDNHPRETGHERIAEKLMETLNDPSITRR